MAIDTHIKFDGIEGESTHKDHKGEIQVLSWSWGLSNDKAGSNTDAGSKAGKAVPGDFRITHRYDKASPVLARNGARGTAIATAVLSARKSGEGQKDFLKITMKEVFIASLQASAAGDESAVEEVALRYGWIDVSYQPADAKGKLGTPVTMSWDLKKNKVT